MEKNLSCGEISSHERGGDKSVLSQFMQFCREICFIAIYAVLLRKIFFAIYALLCGEKFNQKLCLWRKMDKYQLCAILEIFFFLFSTETSTNTDTNYGEDNYVELLHPNAIGCSNVVHFGLKWNTLHEIILSCISQIQIRTMVRITVWNFYTAMQSVPQMFCSVDWNEKHYMKLSCSNQVDFYRPIQSGDRQNMKNTKYKI